MNDKMKDECGVIGVYSDNASITSNLIYLGLFALQHRGQESTGIAISDGKNIEYYKGIGLVNDVFNNDIINKYSGNIAVGHVRYSNGEGSGIENVQPLVAKYKKGQIALAHNGSLTNVNSLKEKLENDGSVFYSSLDSEIVANLIAKNFEEDIYKTINNVMNIINGAFAFVIMTENELIGIRDHFGIRPLCIGKRKNGYILASESCAISAMGGEFVRDLAPGEIVIINKDGLKSIKNKKCIQKKSCIFEFIYFARPDSIIDGINVYKARYNSGRLLAKHFPVKADIVFAVPDSGTSAAIGYAQELGIPFGEGLIKNRYSRRTFIEPAQELREQAVKMKLSVVEVNVKDKIVVIVDDSIVRGTTSKNIMQMVKDAGAKEVHLRIASPPVIFPCYFGIDTPNKDSLIGSTKSKEEIQKYINTDSLEYLSIDNLIKATESEGFCLACLNGEYPVEVPNNN